MPPKGESVQTYLPMEAKKELEAWAAEEQRSISFLVAQILMAALANRRAQNEPPADPPQPEQAKEITARQIRGQQLKAEMQAKKKARQEGRSD
jgi:hypothetical protein